MKVLTVHNEYQQAGGEDLVFEEEADLLEARGHQVMRYRTTNDRVEELGYAALTKETLWSSASYRELRDVMRTERPGVVHLHNTFPLISPSAYYAAASEGVPVVQTLHNYRLLCPNGLFYRDGAPCEDCLGKVVPWPGVLHACYRNSRAATGLVAAMLSAHRALGTYSSKVDAYVALTEFSRQKMVQGGLPPERLHVKPNFVYSDPGPGNGEGGYALFVGRLSKDKGIRTLLAAWQRLDKGVPLKIVGDGPLADLVARAAETNPRVEWLGRKTMQEVNALMRGALTLVFPSELYETFGRVAAESFAAGTPVVAANHGAVAELVEHGRTGLRFRPRDAADLASQVERLLGEPEGRARMRRAARAEFEEKYTAEENYRRLIGIYESAAGAGVRA
ncbi:glycosyltransferase family 4 protein [Rubrobacter aplysinae]|uniref:glycosyltransferase family 4 protein n=1 Tax=Rubrobacter aplysinae TaxID=909625 RepID=UPI00064C1DBF|nr:glycosyltransferase family 4 protein [Rubrobacter aplysinae]